MDEDTRSLIRETIRETLFDIFAAGRGDFPRRPEPPMQLGLPIERRDIERLEHVVDRLHVLAARVATWAPPTCAYNAVDVADILNHVKSIDAKT